MKVGNHGNGDATCEKLIKAVRPSLAVISTNTEDKPDMAGEDEKLKFGIRMELIPRMEKWVWKIRY